MTQPRDKRAGRRMGLTVPERLEAQVSRSATCWFWIGPLATNGYGLLALGAGRKAYAHRCAYENANGPITPASLTVDHTCGVRNCVNPAHLRLLDRETHGRIDQARRTTFAGGNSYKKGTPS